MESNTMRESLTLAACIFNIRASLQQYKEKDPPEVEYYQIKASDLLDWLSMTMTMWNRLEDIERQNDYLTKALADAKRV